MKIVANIGGLKTNVLKIETYFLRNDEFLINEKEIHKS